ncbi:MAG: hypothetical protein HY747_02985 [Elusimicrobia bacterium]|nr:hypothetical protein [Elusimicrobiota bacterium]
MGRLRDNRLGIAGWGYAGRYGFERYAYFFQRLTGLGILLYFSLHIFVTAYRAFGEQAWTRVMSGVDKPFFKLGEYMLFMAVAYHALNGLRVLFSELGLFMGKPIRPVYPYETSLKRQRPLFFIVMALAGVIIVMGGLDLIRYFRP